MVVRFLVWYRNGKASQAGNLCARGLCVEG